MADDPYRYFRLEARELLDQFGPAVLDLEKRGGAGQVRRILRLAHTLKGAARIVKQAEIADGAHAIEEALSPFRDSEEMVPRDAVTAVFGHIDTISDRVVAIESPRSAPPAKPGAPAPTATGQTVEEPLRTVRADIAQMDALLDGIAESHVLLHGLRAGLAPIEQSRQLADLLAEQLTASNATEPSRRPGAGNRTAALAEDLRRNLDTVARRLGSAADLLDRELRQLRESAEQLRLVPAGSAFTSLERTARDTALALAKEVVFTGRGGDIRIDADILTLAQGALVQIVRNAVAHGIELPSERRLRGKEAVGRVRLDVARRGNRIVFTCQDDGRGIDLTEIRRAALRRGLPSETVGRLDGTELINLMLRGGISTSAAVTEIAGRGIGLDVVREASERLGGAVSVATEAGRGTTFELALPLSLVSIEALLIEAAGKTAAVPLDAVRGTLLLSLGALSRVATGATVIHDDQAIPFLWLPRLLGGGPLPTSHNWPTLVVTSSGGVAAIGVERLLGTARIVIRSLPALATAGPLVSGAWLDAEGNPQIVLSSEHLAAQARLPGSAEPEPERVRHPVLVIDDSLTTRMLEQSILESAGYAVDLAVSAEDGLERARLNRYALFLVDVEMPGMDGFTFVERIRADPGLRDIPAVLVTSRAAPEDIKRGYDAGASGYIVKGNFNQAEFLNLIGPLIG